MKHVRIEFEGSKYEGILITESPLFIKLKSGYNMGFPDTATIVDTTEINTEKVQPSIKKNDGLPTLNIVHCGGTIASTIDYTTGAVNANITPEQFLGIYPELQQKVNLNLHLMDNIMSENMRFSDYNKLIEIIKNIDGPIVITHGTDTMHYTAAALSFAVRRHEPIVLVGAQRSPDRGRSDAYLNLNAAVTYALNTKDEGVSVCMHDSINDDKAVIITGTQTRKMHSSKRDAFKSVNVRPLAYVKDTIEQIWSRKVKDARYSSFNETLKITCVYAHPHMHAEEIPSNFDGIVLLGTGLGHMPVSDHKENESILHKIEEACKNTTVVASTQCISGRTNLNVYTPGRILEKVGVLQSPGLLPPDTIFVKLAFCLSNPEFTVNSNIIGELDYPEVIE
jgi:glutamyl-tRNA(Gln) amidotransferase subunit D